MAVVEFKNINFGGIADSPYLGLENSVAEMVGLDIHSEPGLIKVNQKLTKESGSTVDDLAKAVVSCSDGNTYFFGSTNGKVFRRTSGAVWSVQATVSPAAGAVGITGAAEYEGYIYYAMQSRLGRWQIGTSWASRNDNWATFTNTDPEFHPMKVINLVLYIGDKNFVAQVDNSSGSAVFSANALDIYKEYRIKCLGQLSTDLLIGTIISSNVVQTQIFRWNTWSVSFTSSDPIPEVGINSFLETDNYVIVNAGTKGKLYLYNGSQLDDYMQIPGTWGATSKAQVHPNASFNFGGIPLFGLSQVSGNPGKLAVYSLGRSNQRYPYVLNLDFPISTGTFASLEIGAITGAGDVFLVSWKSGSTYGVDVLDLTAKYASAYFLTRVIMLEREVSSTWQQIYAGYRSLPTGTSIDFEKSLNYGALVAVGDTVTDVDRAIRRSDVGVGDASVLQMKVGFTVNGNNAPEVDVVRLIEKPHE